jgi:hypothetical protein
MSAPPCRRLKLFGGETRRVIPVREEALAQVYTHRVTRHGLRIIELALADGQAKPRGMRPLSLHL